jgi:phosphinothricin acetyltransferase
MANDALSVRVRRLQTPDLIQVGEIFGYYALTSVATFEEVPRSADDWDDLRATLADFDLPFLVAETGGSVCGYAYAAPWRRKPAYRHTVEDSIFIDPSCTGRGIGRSLLTDLLRASAQAGARQMIAVIADTGDAASTQLHTGCGFVMAGRLAAVGFKHGRWIDTLLMQRELATSASLTVIRT